jgi:chemotaxis protein methyltransferase WspC
MAYIEIEQLLKKTMGLSTESVGKMSIVRACKARMKMCKVANDKDYFKILQKSCDEVKALIEEVVIPETWFFRDHQPFATLCEHFSKKETKTKLKILSLPCSTGEEPYSIAMSLTQMGLKADQFLIDGIDISTQNIEKAKTCLYGKNSFRGNDLVYRDKFFQEKNGLYLLDSSISNCVRFHVGNLLDIDFVPAEHGYDAIFCRNLLIYFDQTTQHEVSRILNKFLFPKGLLFVGHAEMGALDPEHFKPTAYAKSFSLEKREKKIKTWNDAKKLKNKSAKTMSESEERRRKADLFQPLVERRKAKPLKRNNIPAKRVTEEAAPEVLKGLSKAESLANNGHLSEASEICEEYIASNNKDYRGYFLMGVIRQAVGNRQSATEQFKRVIYLQPDHHDALMYLATLAKQEGNSAEADAFYLRADRVIQRQKDNKAG